MFASYGSQSERAKDDDGIYVQWERHADIGKIVLLGYVQSECSDGGADSERVF